MKTTLCKHLAPYFVTAVLLACLTALPAQAAEEANKAFDAHATVFNYFFKDGDMDFHFGNLVLGSAVNGGVEIGEAFYAASHIKDGDAASWQQMWAEQGKLAEARGEKSLAAGHKVSARDQLMRAAYYYRISVVSMLPDNPLFKANGEKARALARKGGKLFDPPMDYYEVPFDGVKMPGYFWPAAGKGKHKTLLMIGGGETFAEDQIFYIARQAHDRGYNFVTIDLPGQGMMPMQGKIFRTDNDKPLKVVVDYILKRPEVDPAGLAAYGISGGGLFVPQAAEHDQRIKAIAVSSAVVDAYPLFATMPAATDTPEKIAAWSSFHAGVVKSICWRYGAPMDKPSGLVDANKNNTFDPAKVVQPTLLILGEGEYKSAEVQRQQKIAMDNLKNPKKKMVVTPSAEGASNHCIMENRGLVGQVVFDFFDEVLK
jgi:alpha-beta hydrolase superfamily lysophospholipase